MKDLLKLLPMAVLSLLLLNSCSKNDDNPTDGLIQKKVSVEISYQKIDPDQEIGINLAVYGKDLNNIQVDGVQWDETNNISDKEANGTIFIKSFPKTDNLFGTILLKTTKPISFATLNMGYDIPMEGTVKYFVEDELVKTEEIKPSAPTEGPATYIGTVNVAEYK